MTQGRTIVASGIAVDKLEVDERMTESAARLTHLNDAGEARMVDVSEKDITMRTAEARGRVVMSAETLEMIRDNCLTKGDALATARIAGILAAKRTADLIPLCHGLPLSSVEIEFDLQALHTSIDIRAQARTLARTGVEMEALTAVTIAGLTIYDMCKSVDRGMRLTDVRLTHKSGGKSGTYRAE